MRTGQRKSTPKVIEGAVQKKNNWQHSVNPYTAPNVRDIVIEKERPGPGYRHVLHKSDVIRFLELLPDWDTLAIGLNAVVLAQGEWDCGGWHTTGVVGVCAWETEMWHEITAEHYEEHRGILERLGVPCEPLPDGFVRCQFEEHTVRGYQLLHILTHELGHHHDRMTTRSRRRAARGEPFAENYALEREVLLWERYTRAFGL